MSGEQTDTREDLAFTPRTPTEEGEAVLRGLCQQAHHASDLFTSTPDGAAQLDQIAGAVRELYSLTAVDVSDSSLRAVAVAVHALMLRAIAFDDFGFEGLRASQVIDYLGRELLAVLLQLQ